MIVGMFSRPAAISCPGVVLSQEARPTMPSSSAPSTATSMSEAIRSRDGRMYCPAAPAEVIASDGAAVRTSNATPAASSMGFFSGGARGGRPPTRPPAGFLDGLLQRRDDLIEVAEAGRELRGGVDDRDLRLLQVLIRQPERGPLRAAHRPRRAARREVRTQLGGTQRIASGAVRPRNAPWLSSLSCRV